jgi:hypothetical protein
VQRLPADEIKDLNRGRAYLANVADRHGITAYASLEAGLAEVHTIIMRKRTEVAQALAVEALIQRRLSGADEEAFPDLDDSGEGEGEGEGGGEREEEGGNGAAGAPATAMPGLAALPAIVERGAAVLPPALPILPAVAGLGRGGRRHQPRESVITAISTVTSLDADDSDRGLLLAEEDDDVGHLGDRVSGGGTRVSHAHSGSDSSRARSVDGGGALSSRSASGTRFAPGASADSAPVPADGAPSGGVQAVAVAEEDAGAGGDGGPCDSSDAPGGKQGAGGAGAAVSVVSDAGR